MPPAISSLNPSSVRAGSLPIVLQVRGSNFDESMIVRWNGLSLSTNPVSTTELDATVPANLLATPGTFNITVAIPNGFVTAPVAFTVLPLPTITGLSPTLALAGNPSFTLTVNGANYDSGSRVRWNNTILTTTA